MTVAFLLTELRTRGVELLIDGEILRYRCPKGALTHELRQALTSNKAELMQALALSVSPTPRFDVDDNTIVAVLLRGTIIGDCWLVADHEALVEYPEILRAGRPVVFFDELDQLRGKTTAELQTIGLVKSVFPTGRVLQ